VTAPGSHTEGQDAPRAAGSALAADGELAAGQERRTAGPASCQPTGPAGFGGRADARRLGLIGRLAAAASKHPATGRSAVDQACAVPELA
jgi:hypothetical protein